MKNRELTGCRTSGNGRAFVPDAASWSCI